MARKEKQQSTVPSGTPEKQGRVAQMRQVFTASRRLDPLIGWCLTYPVNFTGHPAASIPAGLANGLPVGMQIIGRRYADLDVFAASAAFEKLRPWADTYRIPAGRAV